MKLEKNLVLDGIMTDCRLHEIESRILRLKLNGFLCGGCVALRRILVGRLFLMMRVNLRGIGLVDLT